MLTELATPVTPEVTTVTADLDHQLSVAAVLAGAMPGAVFADDAVHPRAIFVHTPEGNALAGDPASPGFLPDLRDHLAETYRPEQDGDLVLWAEPAWVEAGETFLPDCTAFRVDRRYYKHVDPESRMPPVPAEYDIVALDQTSLHTLRIPDHVRQWIDGNWGSVQHFLRDGFGAAAVRTATVVSWSLADCALGDRAEIGIHTAPDHRRRGLAAAVAGRAVALARRRGIREVGWHCNDDNVGSRRTAEAAGFRLEHEYHLTGFRARE